jgi:two-component system sensor histidine kinase RegB
MPRFGWCDYFVFIRKWECDMMSHPHARLTDYNCDMRNTILSSLPGHSQMRRLVALRSIAVVSQLVTLAVARKILELELDWRPMLLTIAALASINLFSWLRLRSNNPVSNPELFAQLSADVIALTFLLYYGGGSTNPFVSLYLLPLVIAAATLPRHYTWSMAALTVTCYSLLMVYYIPLPHIHHHEDDAFDIHVMGMWLGFVISAVVVAYFVVQMAQAVRSRDETLARVREEILRNERVVALGTQAAGAAHEMGTPLSTMAVVIGELTHDVTDSQAALRASLAILDEQVRVCKRILDKIMTNAQDSGESLPRPADALMAEVVDEWQLLRPTAQYHYHSNGVQPAPPINVDVTLRAALMNLLNNAADASPQPIEIHLAWDSSIFKLEIHDHGKGLSDEATLKAGSAFFTTKKEGRGLGLFLANATVERMGGTVRLFNRAEGCATTELTLPIVGAGI